MGCSPSKSTDVILQAYDVEDAMSNSELHDEMITQHADEYIHRASVLTDVYVTLEEAVAYVLLELGVDRAQAERLVLTVDDNCDGKISSVELVELNLRIKNIKEYLEPKFRDCDTDETGYVTPRDAINILSRELVGIPQRSVVAMVRRFDEDLNDRVDFGELINFYAFIKSKRSRIERRFSELDRDGSGDLDAEELFHVIMKECAVTEDQARAVIEDFDVNHDGRIDREEFVSLWHRLTDP